MYVQTSWVCLRIGGRPEAQMHRALPAPFDVKACLWCAEAYVTYRPSSLYCGRACAHAASLRHIRRRRQSRRHERTVREAHA